VSGQHEWVQRDGGWRCLRCGALTGHPDGPPAADETLRHYEFADGGLVEGEPMDCDELLVHGVMTS
jgi:hypothetical protein